MNDRLLKVTVTGLFICGACVMLLWPNLVGLPPVHAASATKAHYLMRMTLYVLVLLASFFGAFLGSWILLRRIRLQAAIERSENMRLLVESSLQAHANHGSDRG